MHTHTHHDNSIGLFSIRNSIKSVEIVNNYYIIIIQNYKNRCATVTPHREPVAARRRFLTSR